jgi:acetyl-CoA carboxylase biotin carboxyl carrier protein
MSKRPQESDVEFIKALAELLHENDLTEIEVSRSYGEDNALDVRVARQPAITQVTSPAAPLLPPPVLQHTAAVADTQPAAVTVPAIDPADDPGVVASPMVGTAYFQAEPGADPFVKVGDSITEGQTILIIEAMKTMNQIPSPRAGRVKRILVEDGSPVEFGAPLIVLE